MSGHQGNGLAQKPEEINNASQVTEADEWDESKLAALLRFDESSETPEVMGSVDEELESTPALAPEANTVSQAELFDDPIQGKTQPSFSKNPFAKLGGVGLPLLLLFAGGGVFLSGVMGSHKKPAPGVATSPSPTPMPTLAVTPTTETGNLKTQVALGTQTDQIKSLEKSKSPKTPIQKVKSQQTAPQPPASSPLRTVPVSSGQYSPVRYSSSQYWPPQYSPPAFSPRPASSSIPSARPQLVASASLPANVALAPLPAKSVDSKSQAPPQKTTIDPMQQWMALSQLGSYGRSEKAGGAEEAEGAGEAGGAEGAGGEKVSSLNTNRDETSAAEPSSVPEQEPSQENAIAASAPTQVEGRFNAQVNPVEEASLLNGVPMRSLQVGSIAQGQLVTPAIWTPKAATATVAPQARKEAEKFVIQLAEPLSDKDGFVALPQGAQLVAQVVDVKASGLAQLQVTQAVVDGQEYMLPPGAISLRGNEGQPLVASKWGNKRPLIASGDITSFLSGALSKVGQVLIQPNSQTSTSISGNGISSSTSSQSGGRNLLGAVLDGGFTPLTQHIKERSEQQMQDLASRPNVWYLPAGERVQVFVNQSFEF